MEVTCSVSGWKLGRIFRVITAVHHHGIVHWYHNQRLVVCLAVSLEADDQGEEETDDGDDASAHDSDLSEHAETTEPTHDPPVTMVVAVVVEVHVHVTVLVRETGSELTIWHKKMVVVGDRFRSDPTVLVGDGGGGHAFEAVPHDLFDVDLHDLVLFHLDKLFFNDHLLAPICSVVLQHQHSEDDRRKAWIFPDSILNLNDGDTHAELSDDIVTDGMSVHLDLVDVQVESHLSRQLDVLTSIPFSQINGNNFTFISI